MVPEYSPYTLSYKTSPQLYKWGTDFGNGKIDKEIFQFDDNYQRYMDEKFKIQHKAINWNNDYIEDIRTIKHFVFNSLYYSLPVQEDYTIHKLENGIDKLISTNVYFPSLWRPEESLGKSLLTFHEPVPKIKLPQKVLESCVKSRFVRFVWSIFFNSRLNQHPDLPLETFNPSNPIWHIRVERQSIISFPDISCFLFVIKPYIVRNPRIPELLNTIKGMTQEFKDYKRITPEFEEYLKCLSNQKNSDVILADK